MDNPRSGAKQLCIDIAGIRTALALPPCEVTDEAFERYAPFASDDEPHYTFAVRWLDAARGGDEAVRISRAGVKATIARDDFSVEFAEAAKSGVADVFSSIYTLDSMLRVFYSLKLGAAGGFLLHAAGVVRDGVAYVFAGRSGCGKSTAARFSPPGGLLSDELTAVLPGDGSPIAFGTPFMGELGTGSVNISAPVEGFYFLSRSGAYRLAELPANSAVALMLGVAMNFDDGPDTVGKLLGNAVALCSAATCRELCYDKNNSLWDFIDNAKQ